MLLEHMREDSQLDLEAINNGNVNQLPIPATFSSTLMDRESDFKPTVGQYLFDSELVSVVSKKRVIYKVTNLSRLIAQIAQSNHQIEHIYDY